MIKNTLTRHLITMTQESVERITKSGNSDSLALYTFLAMTANIQETDSVWALNSFLIKGLRWSRPRLQKAKKVLFELGLIQENIKHDNEGKIVGKFLYINFLTICPKNDLMVNQSGGNLTVNAPYLNLNAPYLNLNTDSLSKIDNSDKGNTCRQSTQSPSIVPILVPPLKKKYSSLKDISEVDIEAIAETKKITTKDVKSKLEDLEIYCSSRGKTYKNYLSALNGWIKKDIESGKIKQIDTRTKEEKERDWLLACMYAPMGEAKI